MESKLGVSNGNFKLLLPIHKGEKTLTHIDLNKTKNPSRMLFFDSLSDLLLK